MKFSLLLLFAISSTAFARGPAGTFRDFYGPEFHRQPTASSNKNPNVASDLLHRWNRIAIDTTGLDHTPVAPGENRVFGEQLRPSRSSRALAMAPKYRSFIWASTISQATFRDTGGRTQSA